VSGYTNSPNFPTANPFQPALGGLSDTFVTKLNPTGTALVYSSYLGGNNYELPGKITVDSSGSVYLTGDTSSTDFPTVNPLQPSLAGVSDAYVTKLNRAGSAIVFSTYLGGNSTDRGVDMAVDGEGCIYLTGVTSSPDFPNIDAVQPMPDNLSDLSFFASHAFLLKLDAGCSRLDYSTYIGGNNEDAGWNVVVDGRGNVYVIGTTRSTDFPTTPGAFDRQIKQSEPGSPIFSSTSCFIIKLNSTRSRNEAE
jgi:hypothetical protein